MYYEFDILISSVEQIMNFGQIFNELSFFLYNT